MAGKARPPINPQRLKKRVDAAEDIQQHPAAAGGEASSWDAGVSDRFVERRDSRRYVHCRPNVKTYLNTK